MKSKKGKEDQKYPTSNFEKFRNIKSGIGDSEKAKEEKKRLKVFTNLVNNSKTTKKIDEKMKTKEISKESQREFENKAKEE